MLSKLLIFHVPFQCYLYIIYTLLPLLVKYIICNIMYQLLIYRDFLHTEIEVDILILIILIYFKLRSDHLNGKVDS